MIRDLFADWTGWLLMAMLIFVGALVGVVTYASIEESKRWEQFRVEHKCQIVAREKGQPQIGTGISTSGKPVIITTQEADKTSWLCDDGILYTR